ncbi:MAG: NADH-quinone oxidoreductase subunit C [Rectinemataceae bacterium]
MREQIDGKAIETIVETIEAASLLQRVSALRAGGWRLVQILGISTDATIELSYSFGLRHEMRVFRFNAEPEVSVPSITPAFPGAYLYENELRDLFGVQIQCISVDWLGKVYDVAADRPFSRIKVALPSSEGGRA